MAEKKSGNGKPAIDDPLIAELEKQKKQLLETINKKITERKQKLQGQARKDDNYEKVLIGVAYLADAAIHPEKRQEISATLDRAITEERPREFLKKRGWKL
jgi:hypothetical protein